MIKDLIMRNRSFRRFNQKHVVRLETLKGFIEVARLTPSAKNLQPIKYAITNNRNLNKQVFHTLSWAGFLEDWHGPGEGERPSAYVVMLCDTNIADNAEVDSGIAAQTIMLAAAEAGYGGCIMRSVERQKLAEILQLPRHLYIIQVIALGQPREKVALEGAKEGDIRYWRDEDDMHHVPKRPLEDILVFEKGNI